MVINNKEAETVVRGIIQGWISLFGNPRQFLSDNGKEFDNELFRSTCDKYNIRVKSTASRAPYSNGVNERHNGIIGSMVTKLLEEGYDLEDAVCLATSAKNALANINGFSPNQLVFGKNPNFPSVLTSDLPGLEESKEDDILRENLNLMHKSRTEFVRMENDERLKRALKHQTRGHNPSRTYQLGDKVYYHRLNAWSGPALVYGIDDNEILVKHGSHKYQIHPSKIKPVCEEDEIDDRSNEVDNNSENNLQRSERLEKRTPHIADNEQTKQQQNNST